MIYMEFICWEGRQLHYIIFSMKICLRQMQFFSYLNLYCQKM
ncbi:hypothetical protein NC652_031277 [Populus alba x Populus x berolinensis]|uniref:Uncharacterized protein n=1 Tax=Populus alba x Populus x berolinensis TaxID=444605 RepID=A0AAD6Q168_9ROSI|nr:hypothetical protein NC652_031277 [Populus alba x Populus x berolinensis]KAJ6975141.1 hypothetical protein NC653_031093 [Populus alba x Populus x berolinensis]